MEPNQVLANGQDEHKPVMVAETLRFLEPERGGVFVDCTLGLGGHAQALLEAGCEVVGIDRDGEARRRASERLAAYGSRFRAVEGNFKDLRQLQAEPVAGVLADLGVSSMQLDRPERGFSFRFEGPLDMRMNQTDGQTAAEILAESSAEELELIFRRFGEERDARRIARAVVAQRAETPLETTTALRTLIEGVKRGHWQKGREGRVSPATRVFQGLRIAVNDEVAGLDRFVEDAVDCLEVGGRLVVIAYHSLEDRPVKHALRRLALGEIDPVTGRTLPGTQRVDLPVRRAVRPTEEEIASNPRSRSARLRVAVKR